MNKLVLVLITLFCFNSWAATMKESSMKILVGSNSFTVTLNDNETTKKLKEMLPLTIPMKDLNRNEKYYDLPNDLPKDASNPVTIKAGDLMLYGSNTLVLFYKSFSTTYSYTSIGRVDDLSKLESTLGTGDVTVTFE